MTGDVAVRLDNVSFAYEGTPVLEDVSLEVREGDFVSVVGPNGGGKTTLLKLILGLLQPGRGRVRVLGGAPREARERVGYVPQYYQFDAQFPVNVMDVVLMGRLRRGLQVGPYRRRDKAAAEEALRQADLLDLRRRPFSALSGGQRQRTIIARALASEPDLLLLDEPTANVDVKVLDDLGELLLRLNRRLTVVLVSHDMGFVSRLTRSVVCVNRTVTTHPTREISGELIHELYGTHVHMVQHDAEWKEGGAPCSSS